ncbi:MAG: hypothetical protein KGI68_01490 [Alphaproteobacteria bacterium]|nr:hypothetical protein [Alphaproteobacteria bacterium]MDE1986133.1 hypothetical protein [Alphaproteobacteria bacterium]MDE2162872.1 hypothetical protein [Alphaproteobacteria bacterium]MDE2265335.1 hypothetical protein [Alphaproteobacteria bacterium]MDE2501021.1 hypothetical protein [Alphaproteobacteria bacterium]
MTNKIPVIQTIKDSYQFTFGGLGTVIGLIWLPVVIMTVGGYFVMVPYIGGMANVFESGDMSQAGPWLARVYGFELVCIVLMSMVAVAITREILSPLKRPVFLRFGLGATEFRVVGGYFGLLVLMIVFFVFIVLLGVVAGIAIKAALPFVVSAGSGAPMAKIVAGAAAALIGFIAFLALIYIFVRLSFLLAPAAVIDGGFGIEQSWKLTKGNFWRIIVIGLATLVPIMLVAVIAQIAIVGPEMFNPHLEAVKDPAAHLRYSVENMRQLAAHLPMLMGLSFLLAPLSYGLTFAPAAFAYRALTAKAPTPLNQP